MRNFEREAVIDQRDIMRDALRRGMGDLTFSQVRDNFQHRHAMGEFQTVAAQKHDTGPRITTRETMAAERATIEHMQRGQNTVAPIMSEERAASHAAALEFLNPAQRRAIEEILISPAKSMQTAIATAHAGTFVDRVLAPMVADKNVARSPKGIARLAYVDPKNPTDEAVDCYFAPLVSSPRRKAQCEAYVIGLEQNPLAGIEPALHRSRVPARIVWGTGDTVFSPASPDWLDRAFPRSRGVRRVEGAKAFFPEEMPDIIAEEARRLWGVV
jgi:pimeloyl-ACP methyl ester carboxylesterase